MTTKRSKVLSARSQQAKPVSTWGDHGGFRVSQSAGPLKTKPDLSLLTSEQRDAVNEPPARHVCGTSSFKTSLVHRMVHIIPLMFPIMNAWYVPL